MNRRSRSRYFDLSTLFALGLVTLLFISMPGGCGDSDETSDESEENVSSEEAAEPTAPPMMEIVDPEPGDLNSEPPVQDENGETQESEDAPGDEGEAESDQPAGSYVVQQGDTLYGVAVQFNVSMEDLMAANNMDDPNSLQVGQELQIPE